MEVDHGTYSVLGLFKGISWKLSRPRSVLGKNMIMLNISQYYGNEIF